MHKALGLIYSTEEGKRGKKTKKTKKPARRYGGSNL
jgi:hypothetical protein